MRRVLIVVAVVAGMLAAVQPARAAVDATCMSYVTKPVLQAAPDAGLWTGNARSSCSATNVQDSYVGILRNGTLINGYNHVGCFCTSIPWHNKQILDVAGSQCYQTQHFLIFNGGNNNSTVNSQCVYG